LTHQLTGSSEKKPKYTAFLLLNQMRGRRIQLRGEGSWVTGFAAWENNTLKILLSNFDPQNRHFENVPLQIINLKNGLYRLKETYLEGLNQENTFSVTANSLSKSFPLTANNLVLLELTFTSPTSPP
jgi:hypothetical protein